jgi:S-adenosylmethionine-diacylglycerol 3-amino-3-carboxypropyl transferase
MNFRQNALLELKLAGIRNLEHDEFFAVFGDGGTPAFRAWYQQRLRRDLPLSARQYWDDRTHFFARKKPSDSFYHRGTTGFFAKSMMRYFRMTGVLDDLQSIFAAGSLEEQRAIYFERVRHKFWRPSIRRALRSDFALSLLGVPAAQKDHLEQSCGQDIAAFMEDCVETVCTRLPANDNYFWRLYLFGRYTRDCCPEYLREPNFRRLKDGLVDRIETHTNSLTGFLQQHTRPLSRFVLLDHMDWLSHRHPEALAEEWQAIVDRASAGARILWRSGGLSADFVDPVSVRHLGSQTRVGELIRYDRSLATDCHRRDRVHTYGSFHIAHLAA